MRYVTLKEFSAMMEVGQEVSIKELLTRLNGNRKPEDQITEDENSIFQLLDPLEDMESARMVKRDGDRVRRLK